MKNSENKDTILKGCFDYSQFKFSRLVEMIEVIAGISHRINNPLQSVVGFSDLLLQTVEDSQAKHYAERIKSSAMRACEVVENFSHFTNLISNYRVNKRVNISDIINNVMDVVSAHPDFDKIEVQVDLKEDFEMFVPEIMLREAIFRLVENSIEHSEVVDGRRWMKILIKTEKNTGKIYITNSGKGLKMVDQPLIFEHFYTSRNDKLGIGLGIARRLIAIVGGSLKYVNEEGNPAFLVSLPIAQNVFKILVVDDDKDNLDFVSSLLISEGYNVSIASTGEEAIEHLGKEDFDAIILDMLLPDMSGFEIFEKMNPSQRRRVMFFTGDPMNPYLEKLKRRGVKVLYKPMSSRMLIKEITNLLHFFSS